MKRTSIILLFLSGISMAIQAQDTLSLNQAIEMALEKNYSIILQQNELQIARNNNTLGNAGFLPTVDLNAVQNNTINSTNQRTSAGTEKNVNNAHGNSLSAGVSLDWTLFDGFSMFANRSTLEKFEQMGETQARMTVENTITDVILSYYGIVQQKKMVQVLRDAAALSFERKKVAQAKVSLGSGSQLMLLQSSVDLNSDSTQLILQFAAVANGQADLNRLLGRDPGVTFNVTDTIDLKEPLTYDYLVERSATQNTDLLVARINQRLAELSVQNARSQRYPQLDLNAAYNYNTLNSQTGYLEYNKSYGPSYGLTLSYNLFDGSRVNRQVKNAGIERNSADIRYKDTDLGIKTDIFKLYNDYHSNMELVRLETSNQEVSRENVKVALEKYRLGAISDIELRETQKKMIDAQYQLLLSEFQAKRAETELLRISGELYKAIEH